MVCYGRVVLIWNGMDIGMLYYGMVWYDIGMV